MMVSCEQCGKEFLTEADPQASIFKKGKWEHNCGCYFTNKSQALLDESTALIKYFVDRCEGNHPDGPIRSTKTYMKYKDFLKKIGLDNPDKPN